MKKRYAILTGGGCAPGLDPAIEGFVNALSPEREVIGMQYGWKSVVEGNPEYVVLSDKTVRGWVRNSGTSIGTSRIKKITEDNIPTIRNSFQSMGIDGLAAAGGDDTLGNALFLKEHGLPIIGIPKTMDLDLRNTDYSVGFWSYIESTLQNAKDYIETLKSHGRVGVIEVFGRYSGFTAVTLGITADACYIAIPEMEIDVTDLKDNVLRAYQDNRWALVVASEAISFREERIHKPGIDGHINLSGRETGKYLAKTIRKMTGLETKSTQMDHPYRGRLVAYDAFIGFRLGLKAADMVRQNQWGSMISIRGENLRAVPLESFQGTRRIEPGSFWYNLVIGRNTNRF